MSQRKNIANLQVAQCLYDFIEQDVLVGLSIDSNNFWHNFAKIIENLMPVNKKLLTTRDTLQLQIDQWHQSHQGPAFNFSEYKAFLSEIGYLVPQVEDFHISTENVDKELATMAGPQLVVPIMNARFALNAVNARWGSLYDALYGTDIISEDDGAERQGNYNPVRGAKVIAFARDFLDTHLPLQSGSHHQAKHYGLKNNTLTITLDNGNETVLQSAQQYLAFQGEASDPSCLLFMNNGLHFEINFNKESVIGQSDKARISDITLESALTTIMDCEDSVAAVDAEDKVLAYKNWLGLNKGELTENISKNGQSFIRAMAPDRHYKTTDGNELKLKGRSLMFIRNVGHLMTNNAILTSTGEEVPEGILDAMITSLIALYDIQDKTQLNNSAEQSIYIVKPKMHGPEEVAFANLLFEQVEQALSLAKNTIKIGIMDEELSLIHI